MSVLAESSQWFTELLEDVVKMANESRSLFGLKFSQSKCAKMKSLTKVMLPPNSHVKQLKENPVYDFYLNSKTEGQ